MKTYLSPTVNGGTTIVLDSLSEAIAAGNKKLAGRRAKFQAYDPHQKMHMVRTQRETGRSKKTTITVGGYLKKLTESQNKYNACVEAITKGDAQFKDDVSRMAEQLQDLALDLAPQLRANFSGFQRSEDGVSVSPELLAAGEEQCCFRRKEGSEVVKQGSGEGAYRILLSTDVLHQAHPRDDAALVGALVVLLQSYKPVELWIQQGWLGQHTTDGVTLFKLDFTGAFDPTQLLFWSGHEDKDCIFSYYINQELGRENTVTAKAAEIDCDLFLRGDLMKLVGIDEYRYLNLLHTEKLDLMAKWIAETAVQIVFREESNTPVITL